MLTPSRIFHVFVFFRQRKFNVNTNGKFGDICALLATVRGIGRFDSIFDTLLLNYIVCLNGYTRTLCSFRLGWFRMSIRFILS